MWCASAVRLTYEGELEARLSACGLEKDPHGVYVREDDWTGDLKRRMIVAVYPAERVARAYVIANREELTNNSMNVLISHIGQVVGTEQDVLLRETVTKLLQRCMEKFESET